MRAVKLHGEIPADHILRLNVPQDVPEGPAEVILLVPEERAVAGPSLREFLAALRCTPRTPRSKEDIDRYLEEERNSWE